MKIAVYTIALNESAHVQRWAASASEADYRIVADTGSSDDTVELLGRAGVTVHHIAVRPWRFDDARNCAMALIPSDVDICCTLDMDMYLEAGWRRTLEAAWTTELTALYCKMHAGTEYPAKNFHRRWGYRFRRPVHEALFYGPGEVTRYCEEIVIRHDRTTATNHEQYIRLMEQARREDPTDNQIAFWLGRELIWAKQPTRAVEHLLAYLSLPSSTWPDERSEVMRCLAKALPEQRLIWLDKARLEAPHRREVWLDLAEEFHGLSDWPSLFWACLNGITKTRRSGSYLDEANCWGFRIYDLGAIGAWRMNLMDVAVDWGQKALELDPKNERLKTNLAFFIGRRAESFKSADLN